MLARFFKPKWQHHKADVRLQAISKLSADDPESIDILARLALQDPDAEVRAVALSTVDDATLLLKASESDSHIPNRTLAIRRITHLISGELGRLSLQQRLTLLPRIENAEYFTTELLLHLALNADQPELRLHVLERLQDEALLLDLIRQSDSSDLRQRAAQRIERPDLLEQLEKEGKGRDKRIYRIARDKLQRLREQNRQAGERLQRRTALLESLLHLSRTDDFPQYGAKLDALNIQWQQCHSDADSEQRQQWRQLHEQCQQRREQLDRQKMEAEVEAARLVERSQMISRFIDQLNDVTNPEQAQLDTLTEQWQNLQADASAAQQKQISQQFGQWQRHQNAQHMLMAEQPRLEQLTKQLEQALGQADPRRCQRLQKQADKLLNQLDWPDEIPQPDTLKQLQKARQQLQDHEQNLQQQRKENSARFDDALHTLATLIEQGEARQADRQNSEVQKLQAGFNPQQQQQYRNLQARLQELRDWQGYALTPKRQALCEQMEALINSALPPQTLADEIRQLQQQWRELDSSSNVHSRQLWQRFKQASDQAYQPCDAHFAQQREVRQHNLQQREQMCEQLDAYLNQVDWNNVDWRAVETLSRTARQEWRQYSPVDRAPGKTLQTRFNRQIGTLDSQLKNHRKAVQQTKESLLAQAVELQQLDDIQKATRRARDLQQQWKAAGSTFHAQERRLWSEFRAQCNLLFEKRDAQQQQQQAQQRQEQNQLQQLCDALEELKPSSAHGMDISDTLAELDNRYQTLVSQESSLNTGLQKQYQQLSALLNAQQAQRRQLFGDSWKRLQQLDALCQRLENTLLEDTSADISDIEQSWHDAASVSGQWGEAINARFAQAQALSHGTDDPDSDDSQQPADPTYALRTLCIRLEIALGEPSPTEDEALRLEYQMQRLQLALQRQQDGYAMVDVQQLVFERLCLPFRQCNPELNQRFEALLEGYNLN
ncbi:MAG: DUF349 domain-containing protein [Marinobacterium sp.]|nr:DUF349 domain-containing protein [Marinobacterium sp.]